MNWALRQRLASTQQQCLLYVVADSADPNGLTRHCDPTYMEIHARMPSRASLFRRLNELEELGLLRRSKFYSDRGVPIYEIQLDLTVFVDVPVKRRKPSDEDGGPDDENQVPDTAEVSPESQPETMLQETKVSPSASPQSQSCDSISPPISKDSPLPPSGGVVEASDLDGWKEFEAEWPEGIIRHSIARRQWAELTAEQRMLARQAAQGYVVQNRAKTKPANWIGAEKFLRETAAWPKFASLAPDVAKPSSNSFPSQSLEAGAIRALYAIGRAAAPFEHKNRLVYPREVTPQLLRLAESGRPSSWQFVDLGKSIKAWCTFLDAHIFGVRSPFVVSRGDRRGILVPWLFPPSVDGKDVYPITVPPETDLMTEDDDLEFK
jgi:hypothetical protein